MGESFDSVIYVQEDSVSTIAFTGEELKVLERINQKIAAGESLVDIIEFFFRETQHIMPCDRIGIAFSDDGKRLVLYHVVASYSPLYLDKGYTDDLKGSSLEKIFNDQTPRIINDLELYFKAIPIAGQHACFYRKGLSPV